CSKLNCWAIIAFFGFFSSLLGRALRALDASYIAELRMASPGWGSAVISALAKTSNAVTELGAQVIIHEPELGSFYFNGDSHTWRQLNGVSFNKKTVFRNLNPNAKYKPQLFILDGIR